MGLKLSLLEETGECVFLSTEPSLQPLVLWGFCLTVCICFLMDVNARLSWGYILKLTEDLGLRRWVSCKVRGEHENLSLTSEFMLKIKDGHSDTHL